MKSSANLVDLLRILSTCLYRPVIARRRVVGNGHVSTTRDPDPPSLSSLPAYSNQVIERMAVRQHDPVAPTPRTDLANRVYCSLG